MRNERLLVEEHIAFTGRDAHKAEPTTDFDYDAIDRGNPLQSELEQASPKDTSEMLVRVLHLVWLTPNGEVRNARSAMLRFAALSCMVRPDVFGNDSLATIAGRFDVTKQALSHACTTLQDELGLHFRRSYRETARERYRKIQTGHRAYNTGRKHKA